MNMSTLLSYSTASLLLLASPAIAQQASTGSTALRGTNCEQFLDAVQIAAAPSAAGGTQLSAEDLEAAEDAQDEVIITLFWIHGYQTGKTGQAVLLDQQWMAGTVKKMADICTAKGNETLPISEAVKQL
ncbi:MAG: HdeA/HdeB family chaperone [Erythrobacter sp.]|jgi:hypothetical protein|nr:HdeA/HdeB family chaperone [Erythrobacter sp.]